MYPMNQNSEISRCMIALCLFWACRIQVQTSIHVDHAGLKGKQRDLTRMLQGIAPVRKCGGKNLIGCELEATKSAAQKVANYGTNDDNQNSNGQHELLEYSLVAIHSRSIALSNPFQSTRT